LSFEPTAKVTHVVAHAQMFIEIIETAYLKAYQVHMGISV
jgi:hypothetical protein